MSRLYQKSYVLLKIICIVVTFILKIAKYVFTFPLEQQGLALTSKEPSTIYVFHLSSNRVSQLPPLRANNDYSIYIVEDSGVLWRQLFVVHLHNGSCNSRTEVKQSQGQQNKRNHVVLIWVVETLIHLRQVMFTPEFERRISEARELPKSCQQGINCVQIETS